MNIDTTGVSLLRWDDLSVHSIFATGVFHVLHFGGGNEAATSTKKDNISYIERFAFLMGDRIHAGVYL